MGLGAPLVPLGVPRLDLVDECGLRRDTAPEALTTQMAEFDLRHVWEYSAQRLHENFGEDSVSLRNNGLPIRFSSGTDAR